MKKVTALIKKYKILFGIFAATLVIAAPIVFFTVSFNDHVIIEAGDEFSKDALWKTVIRPHVTMEDVVNTDEIGIQRIKVKVFEYIPADVTIEVRDTTAPKVSVKNLVISYGESVQPEEFIVSCKDATAVTYEFVKEPDFFKTGSQIVNLKITDEKNNSVVTAVNLTVIGVRKEYIMELGDELPDASAFVLDESITAQYAQETEISAFSQLGKYEVPVLFNGKENTVTIWVVDKTCPIVETANKEVWLGKTLAPEDFLVSVNDASETSAYFKEEPDFSEEGTQNLTICVRDSAGNVTEKEVELTVKKDVTAPTITTSYIKVTVNGSISYKKNINVSDNCDSASEITLDIDNSNVNLSAVGTYTVYCTATDTSGNTTKKDIIVEVVETSTTVHTQEEINRCCDDLLARIIDDSMSTRDKAYAIYKWTRSNIAYVNNSPKDDWLEGAYNGLVKKQGDCFTYAAVAKALLERIGLQPQVIRKEVTAYTSQSNHYWLLLDLGDGLYHYDPTPRKDGTWFFMWTDAQLKEYSDNHWGSHNFTRSNYPQIQ